MTELSHVTIDRNHPAVKAMTAPRLNVGNADDMAADRLTDALPRLDEDTLSRLPQVRSLMAQAWEDGLHQGYDDGCVLAEEMPPNPYRSVPNNVSKDNRG